MSISEVVNVHIRESFGTREARRLRTAGETPAVLYGHGEETISLSIPNDEVASLVRHGSRVVQLQGAASGNALVVDVQWDAFGNQVLHMDLTRVSAGESIETMVSVELRGDAPGTHEGGVVEHLLHEVEIRCPAISLPEKLRVNVNHLELDQHILVSDLELPEGVTVLTDAEAIVVQCVEAVEEVESEATGEGAEPEVIGRKEAEEGEGE